MRNPTRQPAARHRSRIGGTLIAALLAVTTAVAGGLPAAPGPGAFLGAPLPGVPPAAAGGGGTTSLLGQGYRAAIGPLVPVARESAAKGRAGMRPGPSGAPPLPPLLEALDRPMLAFRRLSDAVRTAVRRKGALSTLDEVTHEVGATVFWAAGFTGAGVDVALVDTGVAPIAGLAGGGHLVLGPDFSSTAGTDDALRDGFGHGTHLAATIAGRDDGPLTPFSAEPGAIRGVAPGARLVDVKVGAADGSVDLGRVVEALDWVVEHGRSGGLDIRVVNLSFGIPASGDDAGLAAAVERAWRSGIVVVAAAGNDGNGTPSRLPAGGPFTITVGSADTDGSILTPDPVSAFTNCSAERPVDLLAPGRSVVALAAPGSDAVRRHPEALVGERMITGTGTSQAAAVVAGAAALLLEQRPGLTPDQVEAILVAGAAPALGSPDCTGAGLLDLATALTVPTPASAGGTGPVAGIGSPGSTSRNASSWTGTSWSGSSWSGSSWSGSSWSGSSWSGAFGAE